MFIDTHAHVNFSNFKDDADEVIHRSLSADVWMILVGAEHKTSVRALEYANKYEKGVYSAVGLHPTHLFDFEIKENDHSYIARGEDFNYDIYEKLASFQKVVAIGEIGLDYYRCLDKVPDKELAKDKQKEIFIKQLLLAAKVGKPVIIHCRQAHDDMLEILKDFRKEYKNLLSEKKPWGVMHSYSGDEETAWKYFSLGFMVSFSGMITFSKQWDELIRKIPTDKFLIETDSPYLTPEPYRGERNEPLLVKYVARRISEIKNLSLERVEEISFKNAKTVFNL
jgi:TatD DNase family protein